jgi:hypothetical protein
MNETWVLFEDYLSDDKAYELKDELKKEGYHVKVEGRYLDGDNPRSWFNKVLVYVG